MRTRLLYAGFGVLATIVGMAAGHLVAALLDPASSPVLAVGSTVIDLTPTPVKEWAVQQFGTKDKPILIGSVLLGALVLAAIGGILARRRFALGAGLLLVLVAASGAAALARPTADLLDVVPASPPAWPRSVRCGGCAEVRRVPTSSTDVGLRPIGSVAEVSWSPWACLRPERP